MFQVASQLLKRECHSIHLFCSLLPSHSQNQSMEDPENRHHWFVLGTPLFPFFLYNPQKLIHCLLSYSIHVSEELIIIKCICNNEKNFLCSLPCYIPPRKLRCVFPHKIASHLAIQELEVHTKE